MWHQVEHNYNTMSDKKYISKLFYYTQIMINILVISFHNINFKEKNDVVVIIFPPCPSTQRSNVQSLCQILFFLQKQNGWKEKHPLDKFFRINSPWGTMPPWKRGLSGNPQPSCLWNNYFEEKTEKDTKW